MSSWPSWAIQLISGLSGLALLLKLGHRRMVSGGGSGAKDAADAKVAASAPFLAFQRAYLAVFYVTMLADWLQGPNMWTVRRAAPVSCGLPCCPRGRFLEFPLP